MRTLIIMTAAIGAVSIATGSATAQAPAVAAVPSISPAGATELAARLQSAFDEYLRQLDGDVTVDGDGPLQVIPDADGYTVAVPGGRISSGGGPVWQVPPITLTVRPINANDFGVSAALTKLPLRLLEADEQIALVSAKDMRFDAVMRFVSGASPYVLDFEGFVSGVSLHDTDSETNLTIGSIDIGQTPTARGALIDMQTAVTVTDVNASSKSRNAVSIGRMSYQGLVGGIDLSRYEAVLRRLSDARKPGARGGPADVEPESALALARAVRGMLETMDVRMEFDDLRVNGPDKDFTVVIGKIVTSLAVDGRSDTAASFDVSVAADRLSIPPIDGVPVDLVPQSVSLGVGVEEVPSGKLWAVLGLDTEPLELVQQRLATYFPAGALADIAQAGTKLLIRNARVTSPTVRVSVGGEGKPELTAAFQATGTLRVVISGLETLGERLQQAGLADHQTMSVISVLTLVGQPDRDSFGRTARRYDFAVEPSGRITLNGADIQPLLAQIQGGGR